MTEKSVTKIYEEIMEQRSELKAMLADEKTSISEISWMPEAEAASKGISKQAEIFKHISRHAKLNAKLAEVELALFDPKYTDRLAGHGMIVQLACIGSHMAYFLARRL